MGRGVTDLEDLAVDGADEDGAVEPADAPDPRALEARRVRAHVEGGEGHEGEGPDAHLREPPPAHLSCRAQHK